MTAFVLVPGACHGGWWYDPLVEVLTDRGYAAVAVTPVGLEDVPDVDRRITLDTHVDQLLEVVDRAAATSGPVVLVGHSYAGTPCTVVADRRPDLVAALVLLDAFLPQDGDSCWTITTQEERDWYVSAAGRTGDGVEPLPFFDGRARPHPIGTLLQQVQLTGAWRDVPVRHFVAVPWPGESPLASSRARAEADDGFVVHDWDTRHNVMHDGPGRVLALLEDVATATRTGR